MVVYADEAVRLRRIMARDQVSEEQVQQAIAAQMLLEEKKRLADYLVDNSEEWQEVCGQLRQLAAILHEREDFFRKTS